ncbi:MAG: protein kinase domain-containing protein [Planctomycetota bacterium]|jgi:serine/threonine protein kinase
MANKTGSVINDKYLIGELIGRDGVHEVYHSTQRIVDGVERKVAIKILHNWNAVEEPERSARIEEISTIAEIGAHPFISSVYDCGVDETLGPWRAMEMAQGALDKRMGEEPTHPGIVRNVMSNMLQALTSIHERETPISHNNIKPRSILQLTPHTWALGNFNLAARSGAEQTLSEVTVKYASPEILDVDLGEVGPASDIYSLGLCLFELALGQRRFREAFPSIYGSGNGTTGGGTSENDKWVYWHVSPQLTLPPLKELLPGFPEDLSDAIEGMLRKPLEERASSAQVLFESIGHQESAFGALMEPAEEPKAKEENPALKKILIGVIAGVLILAIFAIGVKALFLGPTIPALTLKDKTYNSRSQFVQITGLVEDFTPGSRLILKAGKDLLQSRAVAQVDSETGEFSARLELPVLGEYEGLCGVINSQGEILTTTLFTIIRHPPKSVPVRFLTRPAAFSAQIVVYQLVPGTKAGERVPAGKFTTVTDDKGAGTLTVPYGPYRLQVSHPRYRAYRRDLETGLGKAKPIELLLVALPPDAIKAKRQALRDEYEKLKALAAAGDPKAILRMAQIQKELAQLADKTETSVDGEASAEVYAKKKAIQQERMALLKEMSDLQARAAAGDPEAIKRLKEINQRLQELDREEAAITAAAKGTGKGTDATRREESAAELNALAERREELKRRAAAGDPEAIAALKKLDAELRARGLDPENIRAGKAGGARAARAKKRAEERAAIKKRMAELAARAAAGDPEAIAEMAKLKKRLAVLDEEERADNAAAARQRRREAIQKEMADLQARAAAGDPEAIRRLKELKKELAQLDKADAKAARAEKRRKILAEMEELKARAAAGDPEAIRRLKQLKQKLRSLDAEAAAEDRAEKRKAIQDEINSLRARAAAGDPEAIARIQALQKQLKTLDAAERLGGDHESRQKLIQRIEELRKRAAAGDPEAIRELRELERKSEILKALSEGRISAEEADRLLKGAKQLSAFDRVTLMSMDKETLRRYIMDDLPRGTITVTADPVLNKLHVRGVVLDKEELVRVMMRLAPAEERLLLDIRVDPDGLIEMLQAELAKYSFQQATVHPFVIGPRHSIFIGLPLDTSDKRVAAAKLIVEGFIATPDRATVRVVPKPTPLGVKNGLLEGTP